MKQLNVLFIGDIIGALGRDITKQFLPELKKEFDVNLTLANGENSAHGYGITLKIYEEFVKMGIDALTMGNHIWDKKEIAKDFPKYERVVRPANYPKGTPGPEYLIVESNNGVKVGILNLLGRVFMPPLDCPFQVSDQLLPHIKNEAQVVIVDLHAEATSEKNAMGWFLDGRVSAVLGTHTHVLTADEKILPQGTGYITDIGMVGGLDSIIGMNREQILKRFVNCMPEKFEPIEKGRGIFNAVMLQIDASTGKTLKIERIAKTID